MDIIFKTTKLKKVFCSDKELLKEYGKENADKIKKRMAFLRSAPSLSMVPITPPFRRHQLKENLEGLFAVDVKHPDRLVFKPANDPVPLLADGGIDVTKVTAIEIVGVGDYHE